MLALQPCLSFAIYCQAVFDGVCFRKLFVVRILAPVSQPRLAAYAVQVCSTIFVSEAYSVIQACMIHRLCA